MKPTSSSNQRPSQRDNRATCERQSFPQTDYNFQSSGELRGGPHTFLGKRDLSELHTFRKISSEFLGAEVSRDYFAEVMLFILITGVSAWPTISMIATLARMMK